MKALTLYRPWPWAIFHAPRNPKRIENRPWKPWPVVLNQPIALHAGKVFDDGAAGDLAEAYDMHPDGTPLFGTPPPGWRDEGLIGTAIVRGYVESEEGAEQFMVGQAEWFSGPFAWLLSDVRPFVKAIPCKGALSLWEVPVELVKEFKYRD